MTTIERQETDLESFVASAEAFLTAGWPQKNDAEANEPFVWGEGDDGLNLFPEVDLETELAAIERVREYRRALFDAGLGWIEGPVEYGGAALPRAHATAFEKLLRRYDVPGDSLLTVSLGTIAPTILEHGTDEQRNDWLPRLYRGDLIACQLFSEPGAGSDLANISTRAVRDGDGWVLDGQKVWTSGAHLADVGEIICKTSEDGRHNNLTAFMVDMRAPGVEVRPLRQMTGTASFNEVFLSEVWVPDSARLGDVGRGWKVALTTLGNERSAIGNTAFGGLGLLKTDRLIAMLRHTGLNADPLSRQRFAELYCHIRVARYHQERLLALARAGAAPGPEFSMAKLALARNLTRLAEFGASCAGTNVMADTGEWGMYSWASLVCGAPGYHLGGGTDEVMMNILGERVLGLPR